MTNMFGLIAGKTLPEYFTTMVVYFHDGLWLSSCSQECAVTEIEDLSHSVSRLRTDVPWTLSRSHVPDMLIMSGNRPDSRFRIPDRQNDNSIFSCALSSPFARFTVRINWRIANINFTNRGCWCASWKRPETEIHWTQSTCNGNLRYQYHIKMTLDWH